MIKRLILGLTMGIFCLNAPAQAQDTPAPAAVPAPPPASAAITKAPQTVKEEVKLLREERKTQMPYLDRGFIRSEITPQKLREKQQFLEQNQKNLNDIVARAIQVYTPARAAHERISLAKRRIIVALRNLFPEASFIFDPKRGELSDQPYHASHYRFNFRQPLFRGGILWNTLLQEKAGLEASQKEYQSILEDLVSEVSEAYFEYNRAYQVVANQEEALGGIRSYVDISKRKFSEGIISEIENLNVESLFSQLQYDFETSKQELELAKLNVQKFLDLTMDDPIEVRPLYDLKYMVSLEEAAGSEATSESDLFKSEKKMLPLGELVDLAYLNRARLQVEASKLQAARLDERVKMGEFLPHADAIVEFGKLGEAFDPEQPSLKREFNFGIELNWNAGGSKLQYAYVHNQAAPSVSQFRQTSGTHIVENRFKAGILDGLEDFAKIKEAEVARLDQVAELEKAEKEVIQDVKQAYFDYQKAQIQVKATLQRVGYRRRLGTLAKHRLEKNEIQVSEYLQSEIDLIQEISALHKALADYFTAKSKLNHAIGKRDYFPIEGFYGSKSES